MQISSNALATDLLHNLIVQGKFKQNTLKIGRGTSEIIVLRTVEDSDGVYAGIRYNPATGMEFGDSNNWIRFGTAVATDLSYEPIPFTSADLIGGVLQINHNFGSATLKFVGSTHVPKSITYNMNNVQFDFSDQPDTVSGYVWFVGSLTTMKLVPIIDRRYLRVTYPGIGTNVLWKYSSWQQTDEYLNELERPEMSSFWSADGESSSGSYMTFWAPYHYLELFVNNSSVGNSGTTALGNVTWPWETDWSSIPGFSVTPVYQGEIT